MSRDSRSLLTWARHYNSQSQRARSDSQSLCVELGPPIVLDFNVQSNS